MDDCVSLILIEKLIESGLTAVDAAESCCSMFVDVVVVVVVGAVLFDATPCIIITYALKILFDFVLVMTIIITVYRDCSLFFIYYVFYVCCQ